MKCQVNIKQIPALKQSVTSSLWCRKKRTWQLNYYLNGTLMDLLLFPRLQNKSSGATDAENKPYQAPPDVTAV